MCVLRCHARRPTALDIVNFIQWIFCHGKAKKSLGNNDNNQNVDRRDIEM